MSLKANITSVTSNYLVLSSDVVLTVDAASLTVTLPTFEDINIKNTKSYYIQANFAYTLKTDGVSLLAINGTDTYSVAVDQSFYVTYVEGFWYLTVYDVVSTGGSGITQLTGDVTAGPGSGSQVATIANNAVTTAKIANNSVTTAKMVQLGAYKMWANNTNASANAAEHDYQAQGESAITATITFTATTAPSGSSTLSQWFQKIGNTVFYKFMLTYATAGTGMTGLTISFPSEFPPAFIPTGLSGASVNLYYMDYARMVITPSGGTWSTSVAFLRRNAANTDNEFYLTITSNSSRTVHLGGSYQTA